MTMTATGHRGRGSVGRQRAVSPVRRALHALIFGLIFLALGTAALVLRLPLSGQVTLAVGDVSPTDIRSPMKRTFVSDILTERARTAAETGVQDVYDPPEQRVARQQIARTQEVLSYLETVRQDPYA
ncbi:MAG: hypothetical protein GX605_05995, partial [Chloroflexi bacterium]|nr:hypothetical protein [Chloroflexota bacterium]